jgi:hypothetical protein
VIPLQERDLVEIGNTPYKKSLITEFQLIFCGNIEKNLKQPA